MARRKVTRGAAPRILRSKNSKSRSSTSLPTRARGERTSKSDDESPNFLSVYFREMSDLHVMNAEEELIAARKIAALRNELWKAFLSYPPFIDGIVALIESKVDAEDVPARELRVIRKTSRELRDRETRGNKDAFEEAAKQLSEKMGPLDCDEIVADLILTDLRALSMGQRGGLSMAVNPPRRGSQPFRFYYERCRNTSRALKFAKNRFVKANLRLVVSIARRFNHGRMPLQDLIQEGNIGLMKAVDRFDHRRGFRFSTYASWWIRHAISRAIADKGREVRLPVHMIDAYHKLNKARRELETKHGREPTWAELAEQTGFAEAKIEKMAQGWLENPISLDRTVSGDDERRVVEFLEDPNSDEPSEDLEIRVLGEQVRRLLGRLRPIEADILRKRFGFAEDDELTLKEIGGQYSLSRERIRQLQEQALGKIRRELKRLEIM